MPEPLLRANPGGACVCGAVADKDCRCDTLGLPAAARQRRTG
jgi:hypothetical protein